METSNNISPVTERNVIAGLKVIETEYRVLRPAFEEVKIDRPVYVDKQIDVPVGFENVLKYFADQIAQKAAEKCVEIITGRLDKAIDARIKEIELPKITYKEELHVTQIDKEVVNAVIRDQEVINSVIRNQEVINAVIIDKPVVNAVIEDVKMQNAVIEDVFVKNAVVTEVPVVNAKIRDIIVEAVNIKWLKPDGTPDK